MLQTFLDTSTFDGSCNLNVKAYKMDESPSWEAWWDEVGLDLSDLTGPRAPHWFHICKRKDLDLHEFDAPQTSWVGAPAPCSDDIVVAVKDRMASLKPHQTALLIPSSELPARLAAMSIQPTGAHPRRPMKTEDRKLIRDRAAEVYHQGGITQAAYEFLTSWAGGTLRREPRPSTYEFLSPASTTPAAASPVPRIHRIDQPPRPIVVKCADNHPLPIATPDDALSIPLAVFTDQ